MRQHEWEVSWSGGKDSTATVILMHENNIPIKKITYVRMMWDEDIPATLPIMTSFVDMAAKVFESWGYLVEIIPSIRTAKSLCDDKYKKSKREEKNGNYYGVTSFARGMCRFTGYKVKTIKTLQKGEYEMIGYSADELHRLHRLTDTKCSIMFELGITEEQTFDICKKYNLLSPLYDLGFKRDGCWFCPNAAAKERQYLRKNHPELVNLINQSINAPTI
jgi:hypothetical protein